MRRIGMDIGSTTLKTVVLDENGSVIFSDYQRHYSEIAKKCMEMAKRLKAILGSEEVMVSLSGSAGMALAEKAGIPFIQEVYATREAARELKPDSDVIIELGGEDAKILFLTGGLEVRMNGTCAGGTGAFIDQMSTLLGIKEDELGKLSEKSEQIHTIASRCGVFAKTDIQPLINQGARKEDLCASILQAVVNQTIGGLAQGQKIEGNVLYLGGPLSFIPKLRALFDQSLNIKGTCPDHSLLYVALGAALSKNSKRMTVDEIIEGISRYKSTAFSSVLEPLFENEEEYDSFSKRHSRAKLERLDISKYKGNAYLGIDSGSTTIKCCLLSSDCKVLLTDYRENNGNPVSKVKDFLENIYEKYPGISIKASCSTGYGETLMKKAFNLDYSLVETEAHYKGAKHFKKNVDFILDIGGQDIKCFKIKDGAIDDIFLNEACSSGCGSFLQTFANALGKTSKEFSELALYAKRPVNLGSRCTVFMNSAVKQAQKDGASIEDISAGLAISVVKNAIYKVIRARDVGELGANIVVQGGTFLNDAVLRSFERELGAEVIRPDLAGLMGAFGSALHAMDRSGQEVSKKSSTLSLEELRHMTMKNSSARCKGCQNHCLLSICDFGKGRRLISGNKCEKGEDGAGSDNLEDYDIYAYKQNMLSSYRYSDAKKETKRGRLGLPLSLGLYELLPFYSTLFRALGFDVVIPPFSDRELYLKGQPFIPSDTVCFPAKLMHGSIEWLKKEDLDYIFIPASSYNIDEKGGDNNFNCPIVAYYGEVIKDNHDLGRTKLMLGFLSLDNRKHLEKRISSLFDIPLKEVKGAVKSAYKELYDYKARIRAKGSEIIERARAERRRIIVLAGRPYHIDPEVNHGIDNLIVKLGAAVISEDSLSSCEPPHVEVLNQWTYHSRLYESAYIVSESDDMELIQLVSFGCGLDAVTTDEVRSILNGKGKIYTQIKIDEITNMGAVKIRLRSLFAALEA